VDVGTLLRWEGKVTGIPRTVMQFLEVLLREPGLRVRLCSFRVWLGTYEEIPLKHVPLSPAPQREAAAKATPTAAPKSRSGWRDRFRPLYRTLPTDLQHACREGFSAMRYLMRFLLRSGRISLANLVKGLARGAARRMLRRPSRVIFEEGDVLFVPGASWDDFAACEALERLKQSRRLFVVPIVYDIIPAKMPQVCNPLLPTLFAPWIRRLLGLSDLVLTISRYSRDDLLALAERLEMPAPPVEVIRLGDAPAGFDHPARPRDLPAATQTFALTVGTFEARKNHWLLYQVWRRLVEEYGALVPPLVLAGRPGWATQEVLYLIKHDPIVRGRVFVLLDVLDEELAWLYENCLFTIFPSHYEGWGLPVAESLAHGKHCICSNASSLPEVGGDLVDYHDPLDVMGCLQLARRALFEPDFLPKREARIRAEFRPVTWEECGARIPRLLEQNLGVRLRAAENGEAAPSAAA